MAKRIWITCPNPPETWYPRIEEHREQLYRRIKSSIHISDLSPEIMQGLAAAPNEVNFYAHQAVAPPAPA